MIISPDSLAVNSPLRADETPARADRPRPCFPAPEIHAIPPEALTIPAPVIHSLTPEQARAAGAAFKDFFSRRYESDSKWRAAFDERLARLRERDAGKGAADA